jgi:hypothetical protein
MTFSPAAIATARRNVAQRSERFLNGLDRAGRPLNRRELYYPTSRRLSRSWRRGQYPEGEDALLRAERIAPIPKAPATAIPENDFVSIVELRAELGRILEGTLP